MSLKAKVLLIPLVIIAIYTIFIYGVQRFLIFPSFVQIERDTAQKDIKRFIDALDREIRHLDSVCHDWSAWDDTYDFVVEPTQDYIESNLVVSTFTDSRLNLIYICDSNGKVVWGEIHDLDSSDEISLAGIPKTSLEPTHPFFSYEIAEKPLEEVTVSGVLMTEKGPMLVASRPILNSDNEGPIRGSIIFGKFFNEDVQKDLMVQTQVLVKVWSVLSESLPMAEKKILATLSRETPILITEMNKDFLNAYTTFPDLQGKPALFLRAETFREITQNVILSLHYSFQYIVLAGLVLLILAYVALQKTMVEPIVDLTNKIASMRENRDLSKRLQLKRGDEIGTLSRELDLAVDQFREIHPVGKNTPMGEVKTSDEN
jgi:sensor domain CHASE-containing protein